MSLLLNFFLVGEWTWGGHNHDDWTRRRQGQHERLRAFHQDHQPRNQNNKDNGNNNKESNVMDEEEILKLILQGDLNLMEIMPLQERLRNSGRNRNLEHNYANMFRGKFCRLDWTKHEQDPSKTPMFRDVIAASQCGEGSNPHVEFDLFQAVQAVRAYDATLEKERDKGLDHTANNPHVLDLGGVVFHESRCGSTLVANLLQSHDPTQNLVYSESGPPAAILRLADATETDPLLSASNAASILQDVVMLMSRTKVSTKRRVFFKIQSIGTLSLPVFTAAFPTTPWIFVYRDPTEVLMSHLEQGGKHANCVQTQTRGRSVPSRIVDIVTKYAAAGSSANNDPRQLSTEDYCAAHLGTLTELAVQELEPAQHLTHGLAVNYRDLPDLLWDTILPHVWKIPVDADAHQRMQQASTSYSKGRGPRAGVTFEGDSQQKQALASTAVTHAAQTFLQPSFERLQTLAEQAKQTWTAQKPAPP